jgi:hypothetical protein
MSIKLGIISITIALMSVCSPSVWAICSQADAVGLWDVYINDEDGWTFCPLNVDKLGFIALGPTCVRSNGVKYFIEPDSFITVQGNCRASGKVFLTEGVAATFSLMTFTRDKFGFSGIGRYNSGGKFTYTGVKH